MCFPPCADPALTVLNILHFHMKKPISSCLDLQFSQLSPSVVSDFCDPADCSAPGLPVHRQLPEPAEAHAHRVGPYIHAIANTAAVACWHVQGLPYGVSVKVCVVPLLE